MRAELRSAIADTPAPGGLASVQTLAGDFKQEGQKGRRLKNRMHLAPGNAVRPKHCGRAHFPRRQQEGAQKRIGIWAFNLSAFAPFSLALSIEGLPQTLLARLR